MKIFSFLILLFSLSTMSCDIVLEDLKSEELNDLFLDFSTHGIYSVLNSLIDRGADLLATDEQGRTALHLAILKHPQALRTIRLFLAKGLQAKIPRSIQLNVQDDEGNTPLHFAVANGQFELIYELYNEGADTSIRNKQGLRPFDLNDNPDVIKELESQGN